MVMPHTLLKCMELTLYSWRIISFFYSCLWLKCKPLNMGFVCHIRRFTPLAPLLLFGKSKEPFRLMVPMSRLLLTLNHLQSSTQSCLCHSSWDEINNHLNSVLKFPYSFHLSDKSLLNLWFLFYSSDESRQRKQSVLILSCRVYFSDSESNSVTRLKLCSSASNSSHFY